MFIFKWVLQWVVGDNILEWKSFKLFGLEMWIILHESKFNHLIWSMVDHKFIILEDYHS